MNNKSTALLVIDSQKEYGPDGALPISGIKTPLEKIAQLLSAARSNGNLVIHVRHISRNSQDTDFAASSTGIEFIEETCPHEDEIVITKHYPGSFTNEELDGILQKNKIVQLVICGFNTFLCCDTTAREAYQRGYKVFFVEDAMASFDLPEFSGGELHNYACAVQQAIFSNVIDTESIINNVLLENKTKTSSC